MPQYKLENETVTTDANNNVISSKSLQTVPTIQPVRETPDTTDYSGITGGVTQSVINDYNSLSKQLTEKQASQEQGGDDILSLMNKLAGKEADTQAANEIAGVNTETANLNKYVKQLSDLNSQASSLNREAQAIPIQVQQNAQGQGQTDRGVAPIEAGQARINALKALSIGQQSDIAAAAATGSQLRLAAAKDKAQQIVDLKYKPLENLLALKEKQYELNKDSLMAIDKKRTEALGVALTKEANDLADKKANEKAIVEAVTQAGAQGAPTELVKAASEAKSPLEAVKILGKYSGDYLKYEMLKEQIKTEKLQQSKIGIDIQKIKKDMIVSNPTVTPEQAGKYAGALSVILGSSKFTKEQKAAVVNAVNSGQDPFAVIKNNAKDIMTAAVQTDLSKSEVAKSQLDNIDILLDNFYSNGGNTGIFKGNYEKTLNNLGQVVDPKLVGIATQIALAMQEYRLAVTGTAASVQEDARIDNVFPGINSSQGLNEARLNALRTSFDTKIDAAYKTVLGSTYDDLKNSNIKTVTPVNNVFSQAMGASTNTFIPGAAILNKTNPDGSLNFNIPK